MKTVIGIRREDKNQWERRVPLIPDDVAALIHDHGFDVVVQPSDIRAFSDDDYVRAGARIDEDLSSCAVVFAVKEIPSGMFQPARSYIFFSHVIKGQKDNIPMLKRMMELKCNLIDYEKITDHANRRLILFGVHAGLAGMIDTLWALGQRLVWESIPSPFRDIKQAYQYRDLTDAKKHIVQVGEQIKSKGLHPDICPLIFGFAGYGNVSRGAQEIFDLLPVETIEPEQVHKLMKSGSTSRNLLYKVIFKEKHLVKPISPEQSFELQDYYDHPEKYRSVFDEYLPYLTVLINANYWDSRYPRLVTKAGLKELFSRIPKSCLRVIGDIGCDIEGAIECTSRVTDPGDPVYVYNPLTGESENGVAGLGPVILAVDNLPSELPRESSNDFSEMLRPFVPAIAGADYSVSFDKCVLPEEVKKAVILYQGQLTPDYRYLEKYL